MLVRAEDLATSSASPGDRNPRRRHSTDGKRDFIGYSSNRKMPTSSADLLDPTVLEEFKYEKKKN